MEISFYNNQSKDIWDMLFKLLPIIVTFFSAYYMFKVNQRQHELERKRIEQDDLKIRIELFDKRSEVIKQIIKYNQKAHMKADFKLESGEWELFFKIKRDIRFLFKKYEILEEYFTSLESLAMSKRQIEKTNDRLIRENLTIKVGKIMETLGDKFEKAKKSHLEETKLW